MNLFDECENSLKELKGKSASVVTHAVKARAVGDNSGMVDGLLDVLSQLRLERDESIREVGVMCGIGGIIIGAVSVGAGYWAYVRKEKKRHNQEGLVAIENAKQELLSVTASSEQESKECKTETDYEKP